MQVFTGDLGDFDNLRDFFPPDEFGAARKHIRDFFEQFQDAPNVDRWLRVPTRDRSFSLLGDTGLRSGCPSGSRRTTVRALLPGFLALRQDRQDRPQGPPLDRIREHEGVAKPHFYLLFDVWLSPPCPLPSDIQKKAVKQWEDAVLKAVEEECDPFRMRHEYFPGLNFTDAVRIAEAHAHLAGLSEA
ncbi:hypothetical protein ACIQVO_37070 [Streptomyces sp. NPDC101062]|uniref:hypothetical protein n=1 Tax=unclassified Streptomyces TaxID=2593676 RepID=UPI003818FF88